MYGPSPLATFWSSVFHFATNLDSRITNEHIQVHWKDTDSCWSGYSSGIFIFARALCLFFYFFEGRRPPRVEFYFTFLQQAQLHATTKWSAFEEEQGSHTNPASSSLQFVFLVPSRRVARARLGTHSCAAPREKEECSVDRVCHVSLGAGRCLPGKLSDATHSASPTQKVSDDTDSETHTCTKHNTHSSTHGTCTRCVSRDPAHTVTQPSLFKRVLSALAPFLPLVVAPPPVTCVLAVTRTLSSVSCALLREGTVELDGSFVFVLLFSSVYVSYSRVVFWTDWGKKRVLRPPRSHGSRALPPKRRSSRTRPLSNSMTSSLTSSMLLQLTSQRASGVLSLCPRPSH